MEKLNSLLPKFENKALGEKIDLKMITGGKYTVTGTGCAGGRSLEDRRYTDQYGGNPVDICNCVADSE